MGCILFPLEVDAGVCGGFVDFSGVFWGGLWESEVGGGEDEKGRKHLSS